MVTAGLDLRWMGKHQLIVPKGDAQRPEMPIHLLDTSLLCNLSEV